MKWAYKMGLLEKALQYKKEINDKGKTTLIDEIEGPADTVFVENSQNTEAEKINVPDIELTDDSIKNDHDHHSESDVDVDVDEFVHEDLSDITMNEEELLHLNESDLHTIESDSSFDDSDLDLTQGDEKEFLETTTEDVNIADNVETNELILSNKKDDEIFNETDVFSDESKVEKIEIIESSSSGALEEIPSEINNSISEKDNEKDLSFDDISEITLEDETDNDSSNIDYNTDDIEPIDPLDDYDKFMVLYEIEREVNKAEKQNELLDIILFSLMGQIGASSSSIMLQDLEDEFIWKIFESSGVSLNENNIHFNSSSGILKEMIEKKKIIDLDDYKNNQDFREDYFNYISIDGRILVPLKYNNNVFGAIVVGEKLSSDSYNDEDFELLQTIASISSSSLHKIISVEKKNKEIEKLQLYIEQQQQLQKIIEDSSFDPERIKNESSLLEDLKSRGLEGFCFFVKNDNNDYVPVFKEKENFLNIAESHFTINVDTAIINRIKNDKIIEIDDVKTSTLLTDLFSESQLSKMNSCYIFSYVFDGELSAFLLVYRVNEKFINQNLDLFYSLTGYISLYQNLLMDRNIKSDQFFDNFNYMFKRIDDEIVKAQKLEYPLSIILFSIKNYKRFYTVMGHYEINEVINSFEKVIKNRIGDSDFSMRYDRHKILLVLPGKDKKYAIPLANVIKNDISHRYSNKDIQLLVTFLCAMFPEDGDNSYSLIDSID